ncbi:MAG: glycosyltransferase family 2 protein [Acidiphilium sp.]|nr:glycosyltransferase family 2 protein [Acidiphilium sp.]MDD4934301.1 glycosyltransferase family 2 protein [Acidiphilium sp.]
MTQDVGPALCVVVPCYNETPNVAPMVAALDAALAGIDWEVVFVDDDSPDGTADTVRAIARTDRRVRCLRRIGRRGLSSAVIEGALSSSADFLAVIDGDMQHDETRLPVMLDAVRGGADMAVGSRHVGDGDAAGLASPLRERLSAVGIGLAQMLARAPINDPMSGFFLMRRIRFEALAHRLNGQGFKILLDLLLAAPEPLKVVEVPYRFRPRTLGESKLDVLVLVQFAGLLLDKALGGVMPLRFIAFALVGAFGMVVNLAITLAARRFGFDFGTAQAIGTVAAMVANFEMNNRLTYRTMRLRGGGYWRGLVLFMLVCGLGAIANIGIARALYRQDATGIAASAAGAAIGVVWNYAVSATLVWRAR